MVGLRVVGIEEVEVPAAVELTVGYGLWALVWFGCYRALLDRMS